MTQATTTQPIEEKERVARILNAEGYGLYGWFGSADNNEMYHKIYINNGLLEVGKFSYHPKTQVKVSYFAEHSNIASETPERIAEKSRLVMFCRKNNIPYAESLVLGNYDKGRFIEAVRTLLNRLEAQSGETK